MSSSECLAMKNKYEDVKTKIQGVIGFFDDCSNSIMETSSFLHDLIVCGKTFDDGKLEESNGLLGTSKNNLQTIIDECNEKIDFYESEYNKALARERELARVSSGGNSDVKGSKPNDNIRMDVR